MSAEAMDAVYWVSDQEALRPYCTRYALVAPEMIDQALQPADILLDLVGQLRRDVDQFVADQQLTTRDLATLVLTWVQPVTGSPEHSRTDLPPDLERGVICQHSGMPVGECQDSDVCDCFDHEGARR